MQRLQSTHDRILREPDEVHRIQQQLQSTHDRILREPEVRDRTGLSRTTRWRLIKTERFPRPVRLTDHAIGWRESSIDDWLASRDHAPTWCVSMQNCR